MSEESNNHWINNHWIGRIIGAVTISVASFISLMVWDTWDFSLPVIAIISVIMGCLFLVFGGSVWRWIDRIDTWA